MGIAVKACLAVCIDSALETAIWAEIPSLFVEPAYDGIASRSDDAAAEPFNGDDESCEDAVGMTAQFFGALSPAETRSTISVRAMKPEISASVTSPDERLGGIWPLARARRRSWAR